MSGCARIAVMRRTSVSAQLLCYIEDSVKEELGNFVSKKSINDLEFVFSLTMLFYEIFNVF